jgi:predicted nuclease with TOPRIM domain
MELAPVPGESMSLADIERRLEEISNETREIVAKAARAEGKSDFTDRLKAIVDESAALKEKRAYLQNQQQNNAAALQSIENAVATMERTSAEITEWDESLIRQLVETVTVLSADRIMVHLRGGFQIEENLIQSK